MSTYELTGTMFAEMVRGGAVNLRNNADIVNDLNVFPIPDGDTGDNMSRTIEGGAGHFIPEDTENLAKTSEQLAEGMLLSARGNSGVILSQFFEGVSRRLAGSKTADTELLGEAFRSGVRQAYSAVVKPTEGTMLTVMREATEKAAEAVGFNGSLEEFFDVFTAEMHTSLDRTPELLPVLREAGVIDSGGAGFVYIMEGMFSVLRGELIPEASGERPEWTKPSLNAESFGPDTEMKFGYCTELLLQLMNAKTDPGQFDVSKLIAYLEGIGGDSIVAFRTGTVVKIHVHTMSPSKVLDYCQRFGEFITVKIENMCIQHSEATIANRYPASGAESEKQRKPFAVVTVASGEGLCELFRGFGADCIVDGQQTMNPSAEDFINAFDQVNADKIIVLPNNSNIILTARQAAELYDKSEVYVIPSKTISEGYAAFTMLDFSSGDIDCITKELNDAINDVGTGLVTYAVRDSVTNGIEVHRDDWLGFDGKTLVSVAESKTDAACKLFDGMDKTDREVVIVICGKDATSDEMKTVTDHIRSVCGDMEVYEVDGGQDIYSFIFAVE